jgi:hypothetical protein
MIFARDGDSATDAVARGRPSGETEAYCRWIEREAAPCPDDGRRPESHASLDCDDEDAAWTALLAHARTLASQLRGVDEWDVLLADGAAPAPVTTPALRRW